MRFLIDGTPLLLRSGGVKSYLYYWLLHLRKLAGPTAIRIFPFLNELGELRHERSTWARSPHSSACCSCTSQTCEANPC